MKRVFLLSLAAVALLSGGWIVNDRATFEREAWLADYQQLRSATEQSYANLRWSRSSKNVDLVTLNAQALAELQQATSNSAARRALGNFIGGFNDGHFHIEGGPPRPVARLLAVFKKDGSTEVDFAMSAADACGALGFGRTRHQLAIDGASPLEPSTFAAGTITTAAGRKFGVIRIPLFQQREYGAACEQAWPAFSANKTGGCDDGCQEEFAVFAKHEIAQALADDAHALVRAGAEAVLIDLTGNGGGTEWAEYAAAALAPLPLRPPGVAFIRGAHWQKRFDDDIKFMDSLLGSTTDSAERERIIMARAQALAMRDSAATQCDMTALWSDRAVQPACWNVVNLPANMQPQEEQSYQRPYDRALYIMIDAKTASASEQFAAMLKDNGVAETIGQKTMGVGCGYTNGGHPTKLEHSGLVIWMPDCARLRADGSNEFEGVTPDYPVDWGSDQASKTAALRAALDKLPKR